MVQCLCIHLHGANTTRYHKDGSRPYLTAPKAAVLGLCTGSLAAAAINTSTAVVDLLAAAFEVMLVAFRTRLRSIETRNDLERSPYSASPVWSVVVGMEGEALKELGTFSAAKVKHVSRHIKNQSSPINATA